MVTNARGKFTAFEGILKLDGKCPTRSEVLAQAVRNGTCMSPARISSMLRRSLS
ncbi:hypothetical protein ACFVEN_45580 [Streptomyces sp. NPDC057681]|uniref:hypothetical protein n=1 Tax=Streptomyces sp. NPDC057681 TaxID=3346209 RepID=UPI0036CB00E9